MRMELDVTCDTEAVMRIPFNSALNYFPFSCHSPTADFGLLGVLQLWPYSPLETVGGSSTIGWTLYAHFEDIEFVGAAIPQMGKREISSTEKEQRSANIGPVSSVTMAFSNAAKALSTVPVLSNFSSTVGWALDIATGAAKAFGFSKPTTLAPVKRMIVQPGAFMGQNDGFDQSIMLGMSSSNVVPVIDGFGGTDVDEMSFQFITSIFAWNNTVDWSSSNVSSTNLISFNLFPTIFQQTRTIAAIGVTNCTPVAFIGNMFNSWRGSFVFKLKIVKTIFHSGRIAICYSPFESKNAVGASTYANSDYVHRHILDIRTCNEIVLTFPYVNSSPWLSKDESMGVFSVYVVDQLTAPSNVPSTIHILLEVSGGPDLEFSRSCNNNVGIIPSSIQGNMFVGATPQSSEEPCDLVTSTVGSTILPSESTLNSEFCVGEKVSSLRSILKMFAPQRLTVGIGASTVESTLPFAINFTFWDGTTLTFPTTYGDAHDLISPLFLYSRGGMRMKKVPSAFSTGMSTSFVGVHLGTNFPLNTFTRGISDVYGNGIDASYLAGGKFAMLSGGPNNGIYEFAIPQYHERHSRLVVAECSNSASAGVYPVADLGCGIYVNTWGALVAPDYRGSAPSIANATFRAVGDDFGLGGFISTVPISYNGLPGFL